MYLKEFFISYFERYMPNIYYEHILCICYVLILVERLIAKDLISNFTDNVTSFCHHLLANTVRILTYNTKLHLYTFVHSYTAAVYLTVPENLWIWLLCLIVVDLSYYWDHRLNHEVSFLWAFHQVHYSSKQYNLTVAIRQSVVEQLYNFIFYIPAAMIFPPKYVMYSLNIITGYQLFLHTELVDTIKLLESIFHMPKHHRLHHACISSNHKSKNYGGLLLIWDRLFGTFQLKYESTMQLFFYKQNISPPCFNVYYQQIFGLLMLTTKKYKNKYFDRIYSIGSKWYLTCTSQNKPAYKYLPPHIKLFMNIFIFTLISHYVELYNIKEKDASSIIFEVINLLVTIFNFGLLLDGVSYVNIAIIENLHWVIPYFCYSQLLSPLNIILWRFYMFYFIITLVSFINILLCTIAYIVYFVCNGPISMFFSLS